MILNILSVTLSMSFIILLVLFVRKRINQTCSARVLCLLWLVIAIRMLIPVQIQSPIQKVAEIGLNNELMEIFRIEQKQPDTEYTHATGPGTIYYDENKFKQSISLEACILTIWATGAICSMLVIFSSYFNLKTSLKRSRIYFKENDGYSIYIVENLPEPISFGIIKPSVYLPMREIYDNSWIIGHEVTHCHHKDGMMQLLMSMVKIVYWFNPFIYLMDKNWQKDRELYCDETVTKNSSNEEKADYSQVLLYAAEVMIEKRNHFASGLIDGENHLKERILRLTSKARRHTGVLISVFFSISVIMASFVFVLSERSLFSQIPEALTDHLNEVECRGVIVQSSGTGSRFGIGIGESLNLTEKEKEYYVDKYNIYYHSFIESKEEAEREVERVTRQYEKYRNELSKIIEKMDVQPISSKEYGKKEFSGNYTVSIQGKDKISFELLDTGEMMVTTQNLTMDGEIDDYTVAEYYEADEISVEAIKKLMLEIEFWHYSQQGPLWRSMSRNSWYESHGKWLESAR